MRGSCVACGLRLAHRSQSAEGKRDRQRVGCRVGGTIVSLGLSFHSRVYRLPCWLLAKHVSARRYLDNLHRASPDALRNKLDGVLVGCSTNSLPGYPAISRYSPGRCMACDFIPRVERHGVHYVHNGVCQLTSSRLPHFVSSFFWRISSGGQRGSRCI